MNHSVKIDMDNWNRAELFQEFIHVRTSIYDMTVRIDVMNLVKNCKDKGQSFFINFLLYRIAWAECNSGVSYAHSRTKALSL